MIIKNKMIFLLLVISSFIYSEKIEELNLPNGFEISIFADNLNSPRQITETKDGFIIVGSKNGDKIYAIFDEDRDNYAEKRILIADKLQNPTGVTYYQGNLYFSEIDTIWVISNIDEYSTKVKKVISDLGYFLRIVFKGDVDKTISPIELNLMIRIFWP